ncbi:PLASMODESMATA CALLOSE-BINDING PROTEIN 3-like isoform X2 [Zingiber officinale]|uniref:PLASMODESMATA CALLOSE-BINDING PROTEIN 3-like isoform X2 n=1 Tax=Zingiber officinale TaxID=94328 RepID=UPI001C4CDBCD|nr:PLASMODESMATA CALLOSE-BINDING PROTEIN 3-like isoform X2 [Zingiber officinale]
MAAHAVAALFLAMIGGSEATWCVCKPEMGDTALQKTLDYACGAGADCNPILQNGACYSPNTVRSHCSYATNSYYQRKGQAQGACDFSGTATLTTTDPSYSSCTYPATQRLKLYTINEHPGHINPYLLHSIHWRLGRLGTLNRHFQ